jgi:hypothetical protein
LNETFNEDDDGVPAGETNDHELLEALENMVLRASKELSEMHGKAWLDLVLEFRDIWRVRFSAHGPANVHTTEGSSETRCSSVQGKSKTVCTQTLGFHEKADQVA